jgi:hypothetical protein
MNPPRLGLVGIYPEFGFIGIHLKPGLSTWEWGLVGIHMDMGLINILLELGLVGILMVLGLISIVMKWIWLVHFLCWSHRYPSEVRSGWSPPGLGLVVIHQSLCLVVSILWPGLIG